MIEHATQVLDVYWDAITEDATGAPIPAPPAVNVAYDIYVEEITTQENHKKNNEISATNITINHTVRGKWKIGIQPVFVTQAQERSYGPLHWSDEPDNIFGDTFIMRTFFEPGGVVNIRTTP